MVLALPVMQIACHGPVLLITVHLNYFLTNAVDEHQPGDSTNVYCAWHQLSPCWLSHIIWYEKTVNKAYLGNTPLQ